MLNILDDKFKFNLGEIGLKFDSANVWDFKKGMFLILDGSGASVIHQKRPYLFFLLRGNQRNLTNGHYV